MSGSDLTVSARSRIEACVHLEGRCILRAKTLKTVFWTMSASERKRKQKGIANFGGVREKNMYINQKKLTFLKDIFINDRCYFPCLFVSIFLLNTLSSKYFEKYVCSYFKYGQLFRRNMEILSF